MAGSTGPNNCRTQSAGQSAGSDQPGVGNPPDGPSRTTPMDTHAGATSSSNSPVPDGTNAAAAIGAEDRAPASRRLPRETPLRTPSADELPSLTLATIALAHCPRRLQAVTLGCERVLRAARICESSRASCGHGYRESGRLAEVHRNCERALLSTRSRGGAGAIRRR